MRTIFDRILPIHARSAKSVSLLLSLTIFGWGQIAFADQPYSAKTPFPQVAGKIQGQVILSNHSTVANAVIFIADSKLDSLFESKNKGLTSKQLDSSSPSKANTAANLHNDLSCEKPKVAVVSSTCSDENGRFSLNLPSLPSFPLVITVSKNSMSVNLSLGIDDLGNDIGQVALDAAQLEQALDRIAIVEKITPFVKSSMTEQELQANKSSELVLDSEFLSAYGLDVVQSNIEYPGFLALFRDADKDGRMDIYNYSTVLLKTSWKTSLAGMDAKKRQVLLDYVEKGGQLLITNKPQPKLASIEGFI